MAGSPNPVRCKANRLRRGGPPRSRVAAEMDGHPRQNPAYRPATEKAPATGLFLFGLLPGYSSYAAVTACRRQFHWNCSARAPGHRPRAVPASRHAAVRRFRPVRRVANGCETTCLSGGSGGRLRPVAVGCPRLLHKCSMLPPRASRSRRRSPPRAADRPRIGVRRRHRGDREADRRSRECGRQSSSNEGSGNGRRTWWSFGSPSRARRTRR